MNGLNRMSRLKAVVSGLCSLAILCPTDIPVRAQDAPPPPAEQAPPAEPAFTRQKLEQLAAPVALYPDSLLTNVLMAATYPLDIVQAARWRRANPRLKGVELEQALQRQSWDDSVKAMAAFPDVLRMMDEKLEWTGELGEAFLAQEADLMQAVQRLRRKAEKAGNLKSSKQQRVRYVEEYVVIEPVDPEVVYIPYYEPAVYGAWEYVDYPPYVWYPRRRVSNDVLWFGAAVVVGAALWASWDWNRRRVAVDPIRFSRFNRRPVSAVAPITTWRHDPGRRRGAPYRAPVLINKFTPGKPIPGRPGVGTSQPRPAVLPVRPGLPPSTTAPVVRPGTKGPIPATVVPGAKGPTPGVFPPGSKRPPTPAVMPPVKGTPIDKPIATPTIKGPVARPPIVRQPVVRQPVVRPPVVRTAPIARPSRPMPAPRVAPQRPRPVAAPPRRPVAAPRPVAPQRPAAPPRPVRQAPAKR